MCAQALAKVEAMGGKTAQASCHVKLLRCALQPIRYSVLYEVQRRNHSDHSELSELLPLLRLYRDLPCLHRQDDRADGFHWLALFPQKRVCDEMQYCI